jgi:predicted ArsR family transcriptional regulator
VRRHILEILKERNGATVAELAETLAMAPVSVRHHLDILQGDALIRVDRLERSGSVGRPQQVYALTDEAGELFPNNFAALAGDLVRQVKHYLPQSQVDAMFVAMARELAAEFNAPATRNLPMTERVERVAEFLNARGYLASWEQESDESGSFLLHKHNCPSAGVSTEHGELCLMDQTLVDTLFDEHCERVAHMGSDDHCCSYRVRLNSKEGAVESIALFSEPHAVLRSSIALVA